MTASRSPCRVRSSYGVALPAPAEAYVAALVAHPAVVAAWVADAHAETLRAPLHE